MWRPRFLEAVGSRCCLIVILVVALIVRLSLAVHVQATVDTPPARLCLIAGDAEGYWELAKSIVAGKEYSFAARYVLRVPGFSLVLAVSQAIFGDSPFAARCLLACIGTAACGLTYWLGRELADRTTGLIAAGYTALLPTHVLFSVLLLSETTFAFALLLSLIAIVRFTRRSSDRPTPIRAIGGGVGSGLLIGMATLVRPTWLYVGFPISLGVLMTSSNAAARTWPFRCQFVAGLIFGIVGSLAPWTFRNYQVTGHFVPTTLWSGPSLYDGLHPNANGESDMTFYDQENLMHRMSEYEMDREYSRRAWKFAAENPWRVVELAALKQLRYWSLFPNAAQFQSEWMRWLVFLTVLPLFMTSLFGFWIARRDWGLLIVTFGPLLLFAALHLLFVGSIRYRLPAEYPLAIAAAIGIRPILSGTRAVARPCGEDGQECPSS